jgi:hypothetical protein
MPQGHIHLDATLPGEGTSRSFPVGIANPKTLAFDGRALGVANTSERTVTEL